MPDEPMWMALADFRARYPDESQHVEFKTGLSRKKVQEAVVAFSNADGGLVLIGVEDDGTPVGYSLTEGPIQDIHRLCREAFSVGRYDISTLLVGDVSVALLRVQQGQGELAQTSDGRPLVRRGKMNVPLMGSELAALAAERSRERYEDGRVPGADDGVSSELLAAVSEGLGWQDMGRGLAESFLSSEGQLTVAGCLLLCDEPHRWLGRAYIDVQRYRDESTEYDRRERFEGPVTRQIQAAASFIEGELGFGMAFVGVRRVEVPRLPDKVLREALTNAVGHRDYQRNGSAVVVELRPDRVVVRSPGGLVSPVTVENIREQAASRNSHLMRVLRALRVADDAGRGVDTMIDEMTGALLEPPVFEDTGQSVIVTLPLGGTVTVEERAMIHELEAGGVLRPDERRLLIPLLRGQAIDNAVVRRLLGIESHQATRALQRLADSGLVVREGRTSGASYRPVEDLRVRLQSGSSSGQQRAVLELAEEAGEEGIQNADVRALLDVDAQTALHLLASLTDRGQLVRVGQRRGTRYLSVSHQA